MDLTGWWGAAVLAAPFVFLAVVMAGATLSGRRSTATTVPPDIATGRYGAPVPDRRIEKPRATAAKAASQPVAAMPVDKLLAAISSAEQARDETRLAALYVAMARQHLSTGRTDDAAGLLRQSIRISSRLGLQGDHAAARLELGDIALSGGDPTTACEHWQIARGLYFEMKHADALEAAEARMQRTGCPTDWVLNDF